MKLIRKGTFETNSSSTHALVVPHKVDDENWSLSDSLDHDYYFGRQESRLVEDWDEKLAYIYIVIKDLAEWRRNGELDIEIDLDKFKNRINKAYKKALKLVKYKPYNGDPKPNDIFKYIDNDGKGNLGNITFIRLNSDWVMTPYVDHIEDFDSEKFLNKVLNDDEFLLRFIFNKDSYITVGGDEYRGYNLKTIGFQYDYDEDYINKGTEKHPQYEDVGEFWDKLKEYEKENDVFLKGN